MSKFDAILLFCFALTVAAIGADMWLIVNGFEQFRTEVWTFLMAAVTGEIVLFSLYQIVKEKQGSIPKTTRAKHALIDEMEEEDGKAEES